MTTFLFMAGVSVVIGVALAVDSAAPGARVRLRDVASAVAVVAVLAALYALLMLPFGDGSERLYIPVQHRAEVEQAH